MHAVPLNAVEGIFERFWDPMRSRLDQYRFEADAATGGAVNQSWHAIYVTWKSGTGMVARLKRDIDLHADHYDHMNMCISLPASAHMTVTITGDAGRRVVIDRQPGASTYAELEGSLGGAKVIRAIEIEIVDQSRQPGLCIIQWMGLFNRAQREELRNRPSPYSDGWGDLMVPPDQVVEASPKLGLFFGAEDLAALRKKLSRSPYAEMVEAYRAIAKSHLADEPWRGIGQNPNIGVRCGRGGPLRLDPFAMRVCAFIGLLDNDPAMMRMAINHALAAAHCDDWSADFMDTLPGHTFDGRAFFQYRTGVNLVFAWDWAGACLTPAGVAVLAEAVAMKGLPRVHATFMRYPYVRGCNQGAYMSYGGIIFSLALSKVWRHGGDLLDASVKVMDETMNTYFAPDGGAFEGVGYVSSTAGHALVAYQALARHRGVAVETIVPERLVRSANYLTTMMSTTQPFGSAINVADGGRPGICLYPECLATLCAVAKDPAMPGMLAAMLSPESARHEGYATPGSIFNLIYGPESLPKPEMRPPVFRVLPQTGMLCSCRPTDHGPVRLQIIGAPAGAGHAHEDKGSFVLEAFGEEIAIERGQMAYDDSRCSMVKFARYHNVLIPEAPNDPLPPQVNPCRIASIPQGRGDEHTLDAQIDATGVWGDLVQKWVRSIVSPKPTEFTVIDEMTLPESRSVSFHVHSRFPWVKTPAGWVTRGKCAELTVTPEWTPIAESGEEDFVDGGKKPVFHLTLKAKADRAHNLRTLMRVAPA